MSYFQSENYFKLISSLNSLKVIKLSNPEILITSIGSSNFIKNIFTSRNIIIDPDDYVLSNILIKDISYLRKINKNAIYTEFRLHRKHSFDFINNNKISCVIEEYYNIIVNTDNSEDELFNSLSSSKKRQVKASLKNNLKIEIAQNSEEVKEFYSILKDHYRKKVKKPVYSLDFFLKFFRNEDSGRIFLAKYNGKIIGGMVVPFFKKEVMYEWFIAAKDYEYKTIGVYPSVLLTWEVIRYASNNGFKTFDFMGAGPVNKEYGVRNFKMQFGGDLIKTARVKIVHKPILFKIGKLAIDIGLGGKF